MLFRSVYEHHLVHRVPSERPVRPERLLPSVDDGPAQLGQQLQRRLFDQPVLRVRPRSHATDPSTNASRSSDDTSICPVTSFGRRRSRISSSRRIEKVRVRINSAGPARSLSARSASKSGTRSTLMLWSSLFPIALKIVPPPIESSSAKTSLSFSTQRLWWPAPDLLAAMPRPMTRVVSARFKIGRAHV